VIKLSAIMMANGHIWQQRRNHGTTMHPHQEAEYLNEEEFN
jgi:hypothetical protein